MRRLCAGDAMAFTEAGLPAAAAVPDLLSDTSTIFVDETAKLVLHFGHCTERPVGMAVAVFNLAEQEGQVMENAMRGLGRVSVWIAECEINPHIISALPSRQQDSC